MAETTKPITFAGWRPTPADKKPEPVQPTPADLPPPEAGPSFGERLAEAAEGFINLEVIALAFLLPLFFLPLTTEFYEFNKFSLLAVATILGYLAWGIRSAARREFTFKRSFFDLPVLFIWAVTVVSTIFSESLVTSIIGPYGRFYPSILTVTILTLFYFLVSSNLKAPALKWAIFATLLSAVVAVILFLPQYFGINLLGQSWTQNRDFTPLASSTTLAIFALAAAVLALREIIFGGWQRIWPKIGFGLVALFLLSAPALIFIPFDLANKGGFPREIKLDLPTSWSIAATSFRQDPLWGSGPGTFAADFTRYKPLNFNQNQYWAVRFDKPLSEYLLVFAEMGLLGVLAYLFLITRLIRFASGFPREFAPILGTVILLSYLATHANAATSFFLALALGSAALNNETITLQKPKIGWSAFLAAIFIALIFAAGFYRLYAAEANYRASLITNDLQQAYESQRQTIGLFPWRDTYRLTFSQINFNLANALATKENPTDQERNQAQVLIAQALREAREAANLSPISVVNWENLANLYRLLIGVVQDAQNWAADSYQRALVLDLFNPLLHVSFGGLYYQLGQFDQAIEQFKSAVNLKPDFANAHYNLGAAYKEAGKIDLAIQELELALQLSSPQAEGYEQAKKLLDELKAQQKK